MFKHKEIIINIKLFPSEISNNIKEILISKINKKKNLYDEMQHIFITDIEIVSFPKYGITSKTNFNVSFDILCKVKYVKPEIGDIFSAIYLSKNQYGLFLNSPYFKAIVPLAESNINPDNFTKNESIQIEITDVRFQQCIHCIAKIVK